MSIRDTLRDNKRTRRILQILTVLFILTIDLPGIFILYVIWKAHELPLYAEYFIDNILPFFGSMPGDILSMIVGAAPAVLAGVCYTSKGAKRDLNFVGVFCSILAIVGLVCGALGSIALKSKSPTFSAIGTPETLVQLAQSAEIVSRSSLFYLAVFFGIGGSNNED